MSRGKRAPAPRRSRRRGSAGRIVFALLVVMAAGMGGLAMYFGFVPRPWEQFATASDSALADSSPAPPPVDGAPLTAAPLPRDSTAVAAIDVDRTATTADSAMGDIVYHGAGRCVGCHGPFGEGSGPLGPNLRDSVWRSGDGSLASIERAIAAGAPASGEFRIAMPSYAGQLSADDMAHVAAYVFALSHPGALPADALAGARPARDPLNAGAPPPHPTAPPARP